MMRLLILLFVSASIGFGQTRRTIKEKELLGDYSILWGAQHPMGIGEQIELKKGGKFEYGVFAIGDGVGYKTSSMARGDFELTGDTVKLQITERKKEFEQATFLNLRPFYLIRRTSEAKKGGRVCLVPSDVIDSWESARAAYFADPDISRHEHFWSLDIFTR